MKIIILGLVWIVILETCATSAFCQSSRDSNLVVSVNTIKLKLALSDSTTQQMLLAEALLIASLDSLNAVKVLTSDSSGRMLARVKQQYLDRLQGVFTVSQWMGYRQMQSAARDSFYVRMSGKSIPVKELNLGH
jgi:hypothetical protein